MRTRLLFAVCLGTITAGGDQNPRLLDERSREILELALKDGNPDVRKEATVSLSLIGPREPFLSLLISKLRDDDVQVRMAAVASLADLPSAQTRPALENALKDPIPEVSFAAAKALWKVRDPAGEDALLAILSGDAKTSSGFFTKQMRDALRMMHTPKTMFLFALRQGVGFAPVPGVGEGVASMQGLLSDPGVSGRATAALLLGTDKDRRVLTALRDALSDKEWSVRAAAVHSLALRNDRSLRPLFVPLLDDKKGAVRLRAAAAYLRYARGRASRR